jgi:hypothetical protein
MKTTAQITALMLCLVLLAGTLALPRQAQATLGEGVDSVAKDRRAMSAAKGVVTSRNNYTVHEVTSAATTVREYINASGVVFAVAWTGMVFPDLNSLLGSYASEFRDAKRRSPRKHGQKQLKVRGERVTVETWGHMRNLQGRAFLPAMLPEGVTVNEIK